MENIRKKIAQDLDLFPTAVGHKSSNSAVRKQLERPRTSAPVIVVSDSEDDEPKSIASRSGNDRPAAPAIKAPIQGVDGTKAYPIHVPSNRDIVRPTPAPRAERDYETFDTRGIDDVVEYRMSQEDAEKALKDLMSDVYAEPDQDIDMSNAIVEGFRDGVKLLPHQVLGRQWMAGREQGKKMGGILADDMGLGKTIQTLTRIVDNRPKKSDKEAGFAPSTLVICPVALVGQWADEIKKYTANLRVVQHHGPNRTSDPKELQRAHVVITSYQVVASEYAAYTSDSKDESKAKKSKKPTKKGVVLSDDEDSEVDSDDSSVGKTKKTSKAKKVKDALFHVIWFRVVLDEAHNIKNRTTKAAQACCALDSKYRWCLTGTPMQNNVEELYSLIKFLRIKPLNDWITFKEQIAQPVKSGRPQRAMKRLQVVLRACMLRRTKQTRLNGKLLLDLPQRIVNVVHCDFDAGERTFYNSVQERVEGSLEKLKAQGDMNKNYTSMLVLLLRLRQACNHPSLITKDYKKDKEAIDPKAAKDDDDDGADELADLLGGLGLAGNAKKCSVCNQPLQGDDDSCCEGIKQVARRKSMASSSDLPPSSAKTRRILEILAEVDQRSNGEEKTIVFSQFTSMLDLIEPFLRSKRIKYTRYDGSMNKIQRDQSLDNIKNDKDTQVILISFKAGSTGLNLTCCNNVILVDMWWNPALEDQAFDRAHRLGQTRDVNIHKLSIPETVEERILQLQDKKRELANAALSGDKLKNMRLGVDDLMNLFKQGFGRDDDDDDDD